MVEVLFPYIHIFHKCQSPQWRVVLTVTNIRVQLIIVAKHEQKYFYGTVVSDTVRKLYSLQLLTPNKSKTEATQNMGGMQNLGGNAIRIGKL